jgi:ribose transport system substrate-binding protein
VSTIGQTHRRTRHAAGITLTTLVAAAALGGSAALAQSPAADEPLDIAYLSFAVTNTYDAPMLAAAQNAAAQANVRLQVFDAANDPAVQTTQLQDAVASGQFDGIIVQPIYGAGLIPDVSNAIAQGIAVANVDQVLGADLTTSDAQVEGLAANVVFVPSEIGRKLGEQTVAACADVAADPCKVGYIYAFQGYPLDTAIKDAFDAAVAGSPVEIVREGQGFFSALGGLSAAQDMLQAVPDMHVIVGSDQAIQGALTAAAGAGVADKIKTVGYGGARSAIQGVADGARYATVMQLPATEGKLATEQLIEAIRTGTNADGVDPVAALPDSGVVTQANAADMLALAEWDG